MSSFILPALVLLSTLNMVMPLYFDVTDSSSAVRDSHATHVTYYKAPDGKCYRRVVTVDNGVRRADNQEVDCAEAEREIRRQQQRTQQQIDAEFDRLNKDIAETQKRIEDQIKNTIKFDLDF